MLEPWLARALPRVVVHGVSLALVLGTMFALWALGLRKLLRQGYGAGPALWATALSIPPMCAFTSVSNDYKLVVMLVPVFLATMALTHCYLETGRWSFAMVLALVLFAVILMQRSVLVPVWIMTANKFPTVLLLEAVVCWLVRDQAASVSVPRPETA